MLGAQSAQLRTANAAAHSRWSLGTRCLLNHIRGIYLHVLLHVMLSAQPAQLGPANAAACRCAKPAQLTQLGHQESLIDNIRGIYILLHAILGAQPAQLHATNATAHSQPCQCSWDNRKVSLTIQEEYKYFCMHQLVITRQ